jgi:RHS repeat-associated protein
MIEDLNKGIDLITYNHLNLPTHIYFANNGTAGRRIGYVYTADGIKLRKYTHLNTNAEGPVTDYVGAYVYENNELQFIQTSEGRLVPDGNGGYDYEYAIKDHLGNTRVMFDQTGEVLQDQSYYPFGMSMGEALTFDMPSTLPDNTYLYNGKELQMDFDLGWYDYGARFYDPQLGRWHVIDPMCEIARRWTPYQYAYNNPIRFIDPDGMVVDDFYFRQDGTLDRYVENDEPDRVFVATGETTIDANSDSPILEPVYEQVEMSDTEVEQKMDENGYKKVVKEETIIQDETHLFTIEPNGEKDSNTITPVETLEQKNKYVEKEKQLTKVNSKHIETIDTQRTGGYIVERNLVQRSYEYGGKKDNTQRTNKVITFITEIIHSLL